jgi:hypothetical protein
VMGLQSPTLEIEEKALLGEAIKAAVKQANDRSQRISDRPANVPVLADLVDFLFDPTDAMATALRAPITDLRQTGRKMALAFRELTEGDLKGLVDQPTSEGFFTDTPLLVFNLKGLADEKMAIMVIVLNFLVASQFGKQSALGRYSWIIHDETWRLAKFPGFVMSLYASFKLGRSYRVANWIIFHHLKDLWRTSQQDLVEGLFADAATRIIYHTDPEELSLAVGALNLNETVQERIPRLEAGSAIWFIGEDMIEVSHEATPGVLPLLDTSKLDEEDQAA